jgi:hypothetical protein
VQTGLLTLIFAGLDMLLYLMIVRRFDSFKSNLQSHFTCLLIFNNYSPMARMSFQKSLSPRRNYANYIYIISRYLTLNLITSKLYTTSLLSSLNSRQGWGYDSSENNDDEEFDSITDDLGGGLRFARTTSQSELTVDGTSVVVITTTSPVSLIFLFLKLTI